MLNLAAIFVAVIELVSYGPILFHIYADCNYRMYQELKKFYTKMHLSVMHICMMYYVHSGQYFKFVSHICSVIFYVCFPCACYLYSICHMNLKT